MDDRSLMENLLMLEKGACDMYMHGSLESSTGNIHQTFCSALDHSINMQNTIYSQMSAKGWYPTQPVEQDKVNQLKQKFSAQC